MSPSSGIGASVEHWASKTGELLEPREILVPPRPSVRFRARMFDIALWDTCVAILFSPYIPTAFPGKVGEMELNLLVLPSWIFVESILL